MKFDFSLVPFAAENSLATKLIGNIERQENLLTIYYQLEKISQIKLSEVVEKPIRQFDLWEHTCFEFFLGLKGSSQYWEFNLSPAGHWNIFRFPDYRRDIAEEMKFNSLPFQVSQHDNCLRLKLKVNLSPIISPQQNLEIGITAVVEDRENQLSYWALTHPVNQADFHHRDSFLINL